MSRICRQAYEMLRLQHKADKQNWASKVKNSLTENGLRIVWLCQGVGFQNHFVVEFKDRLISCYKQNWHSDRSIENNN